MRHIYFLILLISLNVKAQETAPALTFVDGAKAYESKNFKKAKEIFSQLLTENPENPMVLYNLGLAEYNLGKKGLALGLWRKARLLNPSENNSDKAIQFVEAELFPDKSRSDALYTIYSWLKKVPLNIWLFLAFASFFAFFWNAISFSAKRKIPVAQWPYWQYMLIPFIIFTITLSTFLYFEKIKLMATVILPSITTHTGPSSTSPTLSTLQEGELVSVENKMKEWAQIKTQSGAPGWVEVKNLIVLER